MFEITDEQISDPEQIVSVLNDTLLERIEQAETETLLYLAALPRDSFEWAYFAACVNG